jgi:hypothetical protein
METMAQELVGKSNFCPYRILTYLTKYHGLCKRHISAWPLSSIYKKIPYIISTGCNPSQRAHQSVHPMTVRCLQG